MAMMNKDNAGVRMSLTAVAAALALAGCGGSDDSSPSANNSTTPSYSGVVVANGYTPGSTTGNPTLKAGYYSGATVFVDTNGNGVLDGNEASTKTDCNGHFTLQTNATGQLVA
ncbi:MAG TPA: phosphoesterase, partial [Bordetella sp.]